MRLHLPSRPKRVAVIDLGSNSVKLLVAQQQPGLRPHILSERSEGTRLGEGIHRRFRLGDGAMERTLDVLKDYRREGEALAAGEWAAVATSAVRDADNGAEFQRRFRKAMGFHLRVLSGDEEAELIFRGATSDHDLVTEGARTLVMDSGGGSAEWVSGVAGRVEKRISIPLGCVRMTERFLRGDPYSQKSYESMMGYYEERVRALRADFSAKDCLILGTGGSLCTAAALDMDLPAFSTQHVHGYTMSRETVAFLAERLRRMKNSERLKLPTMPRKRADILVAGVALFDVAMRVLGARWITVSTRGLRYGVLLELLGAAGSRTRTRRR